MAQKITVVLQDDLDGGPANETVRFAIGGTEYEIDLSKKNARALPATGTLHRPCPQSWPGTAPPARAHCVKPRAQRRYPGLGERPRITVSDRGRIPARVVDQYEAGH